MNLDRDLAGLLPVQLVEPPVRRRVPADHAVVGRQQEQAGRLSQIVPSRALHQQSEANALGEMRCNPMDKSLFLCGEGASAFAVEAHEPPHNATSPKHRAELVGEPQWLKDVSIASADCE